MTTGVVNAVSGPFAQELVGSLKQTHVLIDVPHRSVFEMCTQGVFRMQVQHKDLWFAQGPFAHSADSAGQHLIQFVPVSGSEKLSWEEKQGLVGLDEQIPSVQTLVYLIEWYYTTHGIWLFHDQRIDTSTVIDSTPGYERQVYVRCRQGVLEVQAYVPRYYVPTDLAVHVVTEKKLS